MKKTVKKNLVIKSFVVGIMAVYFISVSMFSLFAAEDTGRKPWPIHIQEVKPWEGTLPSIEGMYNPLKDIKIENGNFVRNGKFMFLISEQQFFFPDVCRILGIDMTELRETGHLVSPYSLLIKAKNGKIDATYRTPAITERAVREILSYGIIPQIEFNEGRGIYAMKTVEEHYPDAFMPKGITNFIGYNETNPIGSKLRRSFWQNIFNATAKYPMFSYEAFNEVPYSNGGKYEQELFRKCLEDKFKTVAKMNRILNTKYSSFSEVNIRNHWNWRFGWQREFPGISKNLFTEWCVFQSKRSGEMVKVWYDTMKSMSKYYPSHVTLQSPWLGGPLGFDPREKVKGEDIFGAETYSAAFDGNLSPLLVGLELMMGPQVLDVVRAACPDKPIFDCEGRVGKRNSMGTFASMTSSKIVDLAGTWKFKDGTNTDGEKAGWYRIDFPDTNWGEIKVPGMWGTTKAYKNVQVGWYRRTFEVPNMAFKKYPKLYLSGKDLTDKADVYLNGKYLYTTKKWSELMQIDVTDILKPGHNTIAIRIENRYFRDGMYFGGIRKFIIITDNVKDTSFAYTSPEQLKRFLWNQVAHGFSGKCLWHVQVPISGMPEHGTMYQDALKGLPIFKKELDNVADIVMPRPRIKGRLAIYWPYETLLAVKTSPYCVKGGRTKLGSMDKYYGSMLFSGIPLDFVDSQSVQSSGLNQYQMLCFVNSERLKPAVLPIIERYVRKGGIVVVNGGSLRTDHNWHRPLHGTEFMGVKQIKPIAKPYNVVFEKMLAGKSVMTQSAEEEPTGWRFKVTDPSRTQVIARDKAGEPAIVMTAHGKGSVYYMGASFDYLTMDAFLNKIIDSHNLKRDFEVVLEEGKQNYYIESHIFTKGNKQVWHFTNWNGIGESFTAHIDSNSIPASRVMIRNIANGEFIKSPDGNNIWTKKELQGGLKLFVKPSGTLILLVEKAKRKLRKLEFLSPRHQKLLTDMFDHNIGGKKKAMYFFGLGDFIRFPAINALLKSKNYQIDEQLSYHPDCPVWDGKSKNLARLEDYNMVILVATGTAGILNTNTKDLRSYVKEGGNLLFCNRSNGIQFMRKANHIRSFTENFNMHFNGSGVTGKDYFFDDPLYVIVKDFEKHPVTTGVKSFYCSVLSNIRILNKAIPEVKSMQILFKHGRYGSKDTTDAPAAAAIRYGKGKIVVVNGCRWMESQELKLGDNAQFFLNILNWFENKPTKIMDKEKLHEIVDLSF